MSFKFKPYWVRYALFAFLLLFQSYSLRKDLPKLAPLLTTTIITIVYSEMSARKETDKRIAEIKDEILREIKQLSQTQGKSSTPPISPEEVYKSLRERGRITDQEYKHLLK